MPEQRLANTEEAAQWLMRLDQKFQTNKALRHLSANIELETFFRDLLNLIFGWSLTNANWSAQMNQDSFDLLDVKRGIAIQVTSTTDTAKIRKTLETFHDHGHRNIKRLVFAYPCLRKPETRANLGSLAPAVNFDPVSDRLDFSDLLRAIQDLPIDAQDEVVRLLRRELHPLGAALGLHREECNECVDESAEAVRPLFRHPERPCVGIIGLGFSGSVTAIRLLELATEPLNLLLINSRDYARFGGLAYGEASCGWEHLLNIQAGRISLYRERPTDFLDWVNGLSAAERGSWPEEWRTQIFVASSAVPRLVYGQYLAARFEKARKAAHRMVSVVELTATVESVREATTEVQIGLRASDGHGSQVKCDRVVIATGHDRPVVPECLRHLAPHEDLIDTPYSGDLRERAEELRSDQTVLVVGTGLTSYDAVLTLHRHKFKGTIVMVSRHGFTHKAYPGNHIHDILLLPLPPLPDMHLSAEQMLHRFEAEIDRGKSFFRTTQPEISADVVEERVLKALEPWTARWIQQSDPTQVRKFLDCAKSRITTSRTGIVPEVNSVIRDLKYANSRLQLIAGDIQLVSRTGSGLSVIIRKAADGTEVVLTPALIVCCLGANSDYSNTEHPIWKDLLSAQATCAHAKTHRGISVNEFGALIRGDGSVSERLFAVGPMRQGDEIERHGRLGAFVFSIGTIRNQALLAAIKLLWLTANSRYAALDRYNRKRIDLACEELFIRRSSDSTKYLVNAILAVRLSDVASCLRADDESSVDHIDLWLKRLFKEVSKGEIEKTATAVRADTAVIEHVFWYRGHLEAALAATDIRRLASDHHRVHQYGVETRTEFLEERLACSSLLRASAAVFGAATGSMRIYSPDDQKLYPFAMYRRVESFTPTATGQGVAGALVKAFIERDGVAEFKGVQLCRSEGQLFGASVRDYNDLDAELKKENYWHHERQFPSVLIALLVCEGQLLGVVYIEAPKSREYDCRDVQLLAELMSSKLEMAKRAQREWDRQSRLSYRLGDFEGAELRTVDLSKRDLSKAVFRCAEMAGANLDRTVLTGANFDQSDLRQATMRSATLVGASFVQANLAGAVLDGADINYTRFSGSDLSGCRLSGTSLENSSFAEANLSNVTLRHMDVSTLTFTNAVMRDCTLTQLQGVGKADWSGVDLARCRMDRGVWDALPESVRRIHLGSVLVENQPIAV